MGTRTSLSPGCLLVQIRLTFNITVSSRKIKKRPFFEPLGASNTIFFNFCMFNTQTNIKKLRSFQSDHFQVHIFYPALWDAKMKIFNFFNFYLLKIDFSTSNFQNFSIRSSPKISFFKDKQNAMIFRSIPSTELSEMAKWNFHLIFKIFKI